MVEEGVSNERGEKDSRRIGENNGFSSGGERGE
jgi:hypothetical protein